MKNKEIEEIKLKNLLNSLKEETDKAEKNGTLFIRYLDFSVSTAKILLSYIEQLETNYKEANESITWWQNRYNAIVKQNDDNHKNVVKLENNRDKAIKFINKVEGPMAVSHKIILKNILKGDSDE